MQPSSLRPRHPANPTRTNPSAHRPTHRPTRHHLRTQVSPNAASRLRANMPAVRVNCKSLGARKPLALDQLATTARVFSV
jgi:hypothetical protein